MIKDHPWLGVGPGNFQDYYTQYKLPTASEEIRDPHNFLLEVWATSGSFALVALCVALLVCGWRTLRSAGGPMKPEPAPARALPGGANG